MPMQRFARGADSLRSTEGRSSVLDSDESAVFVPGRGGGDDSLAVVEATDVIPGNSSTPFSIVIGGNETGTINSPTDRDWFRVTLSEGEYYLFTVNGTLVDASIDIFSASGTQLAHASGEGTESGLIFAAPVAGTYYVSVGSASLSSVGDYTVTADISSPTDSINWEQTMSTSAIQVYFATSGQSFSGETALRNWTGAEINAAMAALGSYAAFTNLTFTQTNSVGSAQLVLTLTDLESGVLGYAEVGTPYVFFDPNEAGWNSTGLQQGGYGFVTLIHEFGHALGLAHPHDQGGGSPILPGAGLPFGQYGAFGFNQGVFTTMTYNDGWPSGPTSMSTVNALGWQGTPMALDIALLQEFYGVNTNYNNTSTTYALTASPSMYRSIWDTGGVDTISFAGSAAATIDLRAATLEYETGGAGYVSYVAGVSGGFTIAHGVVIENATGGNGNDTITGNSGANILSGGGGNDSIVGLGGVDTMNGGGGDDNILALLGDSVDGGDGMDFVTLDASVLTTNVNWNVAQVSSSTGISIGGGTIRNVERFDLATGSGNDVLTTSTLVGVSYWAAGDGVDQFVGDFSAATQRVVLTSLSQSILSGDASIQLSGVEIFTVTGGSGDDAMSGGALGDVLTGNSGNDSLYGDGGNDVINGGDGDDSLGGGEGDDTLDGGAGNDTIYRDAGADIIRGGAGDDTLEVDVGDWVDGGDGVDRAVVFLSAVAPSYDATMAATSNGFTFADGAHVQNVERFQVYTGEVASQVTANFMQAGSNWQGSRQFIDHFVLDLSAVTQAINMQFGIADPIVQSGLLVSISWNSALQFQTAFVDAFTILGGSANDSLRGHDQADVLSGNDGSDTLDGGGGNDILDGGAGADTMLGGAGNDTYTVDDAGDVIIELSGQGVDLVQTFVTFQIGANIEDLALIGLGAITGNGNALNNTITGNGAANTLFGFDGNDILDGGAGADQMFGGLGNDTYYVDNAGDVTSEASALGGIDIVYSSVNRQLTANIENLTLTGSAQIGYGNIIDNTIVGNATANTLYGFEGNDRLDGGTGADTMFGASGNDTYVVDNVNDITVEGIAGPSGGVDTIESSVDRGLNANIENLTLTGTAAIGYGNVLDNVMTGNASANQLFGFDGNDILNGGAGADQMFGGNGNDTYYVDNAGDVTSETSAAGGIDTVISSVARTLSANIENLTLTGSANITGGGNVLDNVIIGNSGDNTLYGLDGADTLDGGLGADFLQGGAGADTYVFSTAIGGGNVDTIFGYNVADDTIQLSSSVFTGLSVGALDAGAFVIGTAAADADDRIIYNSGTGQLFFDADGNGAGAAVLFATLSPGLALTSADFIVGGP